MNARLPYCGTMLRRADPDRFLSTLFAPADRRDALFALYAFDQEIGKTPERVSEPAIGLIRLQWWHETVEGLAAGTVREHPVAEALAHAVSSGQIDVRHLKAAVEGRETEIEDPPPADEDELRARVRAIHGPIFAAALEVLRGGPGESDSTLPEVAGEAWGLVDLCRRVGRHAAGGRRWLPDTAMHAARAREQDLLSGRATEEVKAAWSALADLASAALIEARTRAAGSEAVVLPALLPLSLADQALARLRRNRGVLLQRPVEPNRLAKQWRLVRCAWRRELVLRADDGR